MVPNISLRKCMRGAQLSTSLDCTVRHFGWESEQALEYLNIFPAPPKDPVEIEDWRYEPNIGCYTRDEDSDTYTRSVMIPNCGEIKIIFAHTKTTDVKGSDIDDIATYGSSNPYGKGKYPCFFFGTGEKRKIYILSFRLKHIGKYNGQTIKLFPIFGKFSGVTELENQFHILSLCSNIPLIYHLCGSDLKSLHILDASEIVPKMINVDDPSQPDSVLSEKLAISDNRTIKLCGLFGYPYIFYQCKLYGLDYKIYDMNLKVVAECEQLYSIVQCTKSSVMFIASHFKKFIKFRYITRSDWNQRLSKGEIISLDQCKPIVIEELGKITETAEGPYIVLTMEPLFIICAPDTSKIETMKLFVFVLDENDLRFLNVYSTKLDFTSINAKMTKDGKIIIADNAAVYTLTPTTTKEKALKKIKY